VICLEDSNIKKIREEYGYGEEEKEGEEGILDLFIEYIKSKSEKSKAKSKAIL